MSPQFKIHGKERKALKKRLSLLRLDIARFWHEWSVNNDMYISYGRENPLSRADAQEHYDYLVSNAEEILTALMEEQK